MASNEFDAIIGLAKRVVGIHQKVAADVYPNGVVLKCGRCRHTEQATSAQAARYLSTGWPRHCGSSMTVEGVANA